MNEPDRLRVDIWSDVICPWCYLGKRRFEVALASLPWAAAVEVRWRAFLLDPRATAVPGDLRVALERKYGPGAFDAMVGRFAALGPPLGITYRFDRAQRVSTRDAHRLLAWAWDTGGATAQTALQERLFRAYFEEGRNVAEPAVLAALAEEADLPGGDAADVVGSAAYAGEVAEDLRLAADRQLTGVPAFVIDDRVLIPGAQEVETFQSILQRLWDRRLQEADTRA